MSRPIIHQQIEYLLKKINEQHEQMRLKQNSIPQADMDSMIQNLRQLYEAALVLYQNNTFAALDEMNAAAEQQILAEKRANELRQAQKTEEPVRPAPVEEMFVQVPSEAKAEKSKPKKPVGNVNASLFEHGSTLGGKFESEETLHKKISGNASGETVAHKMHRHPIKDLKAAIGINEKFLFINKLFDGNSRQYNEAVERINTSSGFSSAKQIIEEELFPKYDWQKDSEPVKEFMELVARRFIAG